MGLNDPLIVDIAGGQTLQAYYHLLQILGAVGEKPNRTKISLSAFKAGSTVFAFSRTPELDRTDVLLPRREGNISLRIKFKDATEVVVQVITHFVYYNSHFSIDKDGIIKTQYIV